MIKNAGYHIFYSKKGDFEVGDYIFEIGGKNKTMKQIKDAGENAYLVKEITADQLKPQDIVKFYTGDKLAVDGDIIDETIRIIYQNFWIAFGSDIFGVALGALGYLSPLMAGSLHIFHTLGIVGNSSRILLFSPQ